MPEKKTARSYPPAAATIRAEVVDVRRHDDDDRRVIRYRRPDGVIHRAHILRAAWPTLYWPPCVGDVIRVVIDPIISMEARPRAGVGRG